MSDSPNKVNKTDGTAESSRAGGFFSSEQLRFVLVGGFNTVLDFGLLNLFTLLGMPSIAANTCSTGIAMASSFILNKKYTFRSDSQHHLREVVLFIVFTLIGLWLIQNAVVAFLLTIIPLDFEQIIRLNAAKLIGTGVSMVWNYLAYKYVVFR